MSRELFPILDQMVFMNHAGVAPLSGPACQALQSWAQDAAERAYTSGQWYQRAAQLKALATRMIGVGRSNDIALIPNTSTGISIAANGLSWSPGDRVIITNVEYPANRYPWIDVAARHDIEVVKVPQQPDGRIDVGQVCDAIDQQTRIVSISHVQYASGHRMDLKPIADAIHAVGGWLIVDAIQSVGLMPLDIETWGVDFLAADGHKWMLGPEGCGFLYCRPEFCEQLHPSIVGWMNMVDPLNFGDYQYKFQPDARKFEPGSWNIPGIYALAASLELLLDVGLDQVWQRVEALTHQIHEGLESLGYTVFSPRDESHERSGIVMADVPKSVGSPDKVAAALAKKQIEVAVRNGRLRVSPHFYNTADQVEQLLDALPRG